MRVWVVEMYSRQHRKWQPCADAKLTRRDANREKRDYWEHNYPILRFRVRKYTPEN